MELSEIRQKQKWETMDTADEGRTSISPRPSEPLHLHNIEDRGDVENDANNQIDSPSSANATGFQQFERQKIGAYGSISPRSGAMTWSNRIPWIKAAHKFYQKQKPGDDDVSDHYMLQPGKDGVIVMPAGSLLSQASTNPCSPGAPTISLSISSPKNDELSNNSNPAVLPSPSSGTLKTQTTDVEDWDNQEWTPKDSSYGAAFPVCGFLPKNVRRAIEFSLIAGALFGVIYVIVSVSIKLTNEHRRKNENNSTVNNNFLNDDHYIEYNQNQDDDVDDDDYFNEDDAYEEEGDDEVEEENYYNDYSGRMLRNSKFPSFSWLD